MKRVQPLCKYVSTEHPGRTQKTVSAYGMCACVHQGLQRVCWKSLWPHEHKPIMIFVPSANSLS